MRGRTLIAAFVAAGPAFLCGALTPLQASAEDGPAAITSAGPNPGAPDTAAAQAPAPAEAAALPPEATPVVAGIRTKLADAAFRKDASADDIAVLRAFYNERSDSLWMTDMGFSQEALAAIDEVMKADDWGLSRADFALPAAPRGDPAALGGPHRRKRDQTRPRNPQICALCAGGTRRSHQAQQAVRRCPEPARSEDGAGRDRKRRSPGCLSSLAASEARAIPAPASGARERPLRGRR